MGESIWYCESDERVRQDVISALEEAGYRVRVAADAQSLIAWAHEAGRAPNLVLTDSIAPGMPGDELVAAVRERFPEVPAIFISGRPASDPPQNGGTARSWFVRKPYRRQELLARVAEALGG